MNTKQGLSVPVIVGSGLVLALSSLALFFMVQWMRSHFSASYSNAERFLRQGKLEQAFALSEKISGESAKSELLRGKIFLARSLQLQRKDGWRQYGTDSTEWLKGPDVDSALHCFQRAIAADSRSTDARYFFGLVYKEKGWLREAEDAFYETLRLDPEHLDARLALGSLYAQFDRPKEAVLQLREAYELEPENPQVAKNLAFIYRFHLEMPESSIVWLSRYLNLARKGDIDINRAILEYQEIVDRYPEYAPEEPPEWKKRSRRKFVPRDR